MAFPTRRCATLTDEPQPAQRTEPLAHQPRFLQLSNYFLGQNITLNVAAELSARGVRSQLAIGVMSKIACAIWLMRCPQPLERGCRGRRCSYRWLKRGFIYILTNLYVPNRTRARFWSMQSPPKSTPPQRHDPFSTVTPMTSLGS